MEMEVRQVKAEEVVELRHRVLRAGLPRESARFPGDELETSRHFAAVDEGGRVVGCLTLHLNEWEGRRAYQLRGMATTDEVRGKGMGKMLMAAAEAFVAASGVGILWCNARVPAMGFYLGVGWEVRSGEFDIPTAGPHVRMVKQIV